MKDTIKIVIADDDPNIRQTLADIFIEEGYEVETAKSGYELLAYLKEKSADILILDLIMPDKDGLEVIFAVKAILPKIKIIIYTGFAKYRDSIYAREADRFLLKSAGPKELLEAVKDLI